MRTTTAHRTTRLATSLLLSSAALTAAGGYIHAREWLQVYRDVPSIIPGAAVVRIGFPINVGASLLLAALLVAAVWKPRLSALAIGATGAFQLGALAVLVLTRTRGVLGWMEPGWTTSANQTLVVEVATLISLAVCAASILWSRPPRPVMDIVDEVPVPG